MSLTSLAKRLVDTLLWPLPWLALAALWLLLAAVNAIRSVWLALWQRR